MPDATGVAPGRAHPEHRFALYEDDIPHAVACQVIGGAGAHAPTADDHDVCGCLHVASLHEKREGRRRFADNYVGVSLAALWMCHPCNNKMDRPLL